MVNSFHVFSLFVIQSILADEDTLLPPPPVSPSSRCLSSTTDCEDDEFQLACFLEEGLASLKNDGCKDLAQKGFCTSHPTEMAAYCCLTFSNFCNPSPENPPILDPSQQVLTDSDDVASKPARELNASPSHRPTPSSIRRSEQEPSAAVKQSQLIKNSFDTRTLHASASTCGTLELLGTGISEVASGIGESIPEFLQHAVSDLLHHKTTSPLRQLATYKALERRARRQLAKQLATQQASAAVSDALTADLSDIADPKVMSNTAVILEMIGVKVEETETLTCNRVETDFGDFLTEIVTLLRNCDNCTQTLTQALFYQPTGASTPDPFELSHEFLGFIGTLGNSTVTADVSSSCLTVKDFLVNLLSKAARLFQSGQYPSLLKLTSSVSTVQQNLGNPMALEKLQHGVEHIYYDVFHCTPFEASKTTATEVMQQRRLLHVQTSQEGALEPLAVGDLRFLQEEPSATLGEAIKESNFVPNVIQNPQMEGQPCLDLPDRFRQAVGEGYKNTTCIRILSRIGCLPEREIIAINQLARACSKTWITACYDKVKGNQTELSQVEALLQEKRCPKKETIYPSTTPASSSTIETTSILRQQPTTVVTTQRLILGTPDSACSTNVWFIPFLIIILQILFR